MRRTNLAALASVLFEVGWESGVDFLFADLGVSSMQIDDPSRGFTFKHDALLDMRMNSGARALGRRVARARLGRGSARALREDADEPYAERLAAPSSRRGRVRTTFELAQAIRAAFPAQAGEEELVRSTRRVFQALRIEVNDELGVLESLLRALPQCLRSGGRAAVLTFHSGEDRRVKKSFESGLQRGVYSAASADVIRASSEERHANPRASSAKLRWVRRS